MRSRHSSVIQPPRTALFFLPTTHVVCCSPVVSRRMQSGGGGTSSSSSFSNSEEAFRYAQSQQRRTFPSQEDDLLVSSALQAVKAVNQIKACGAKGSMSLLLEDEAHLKREYKLLVQRYHPDRVNVASSYPDSTEQLRRVTEAYQILSKLPMSDRCKIAKEFAGPLGYDPQDPYASAASAARRREEYKHAQENFRDSKDDHHTTGAASGKKRATTASASSSSQEDECVVDAAFYRKMYPEAQQEENRQPSPGMPSVNDDSDDTRHHHEPNPFQSVHVPLSPRGDMIRRNLASTTSDSATQSESARRAAEKKKETLDQQAARVKAERAQEKAKREEEEEARREAKNDSEQHEQEHHQNSKKNGQEDFNEQHRRSAEEERRYEKEKAEGRAFYPDGTPIPTSREKFRSFFSNLFKGIFLTNWTATGSPVIFMFVFFFMTQSTPALIFHQVMEHTLNHGAAEKAKKAKRRQMDAQLGDVAHYTRCPRRMSTLRRNALLGSEREALCREERLALDIAAITVTEDHLQFLFKRAKENAQQLDFTKQKKVQATAVAFAE